MQDKSAITSGWREKKKPSVAPYYVVAISWIIFALMFPMYTLGHFITIILISAAELIILKRLIKPKIIRVPLPYSAPRSGVADVDRTIEIGAEYIRKVDNIAVELAESDVKLAAKLVRIRDLMSQIFEYVSKNPDKLPRIRRFLNFYLPTLEKLMTTYLELNSQKIKGENIVGALSGIESILDTIEPAFEKLLNDLYEDRVIDVSAEISVLQNMLGKEGLTVERPENEL